MKSNRIISFIIILFTYIFASILGVFVYKQNISNNIYINILYADIVATLFVYAIGIVFNNASVYDPYWSVAPMVILPLILFEHSSFNLGNVLLLTVVFYWSVRLTINWAYTFKSLSHQDWRYTMIKDRTKKFFPIVSLFGINLMPTLIVYIAILPAIYYIINLEFHLLNIIGFILCVVAVTIQLISDYQMHKFRKNNLYKSKSINSGLWKYSRHPNYFGEILMWWSVWFICFSSDISSWYLIVGALLNTILFLIVSIPMQEKRLLNSKDNYKDYINTTSMLVPWFKK